MRAIVPLEEERRTNRFEMELIQDARDQSRATHASRKKHAHARSCSIAENVTGSTHACVRACFAQDRCVARGVTPCWRLTLIETWLRFVTNAAKDTERPYCTCSKFFFKHSNRNKLTVNQLSLQKV